MNLYSGYGIGTEESSLAWINLDSAKLLTLNESSEAVLEKDGRKLRVVLQSGDMFFCILENLDDDEALGQDFASSHHLPISSDFFRYYPIIY